MMQDAFGAYGNIYSKILDLLDDTMKSEEVCNIREGLMLNPLLLFVLATHFEAQKLEVTWDNLFFLQEWLSMKGEIVV